MLDLTPVEYNAFQCVDPRAIMGPPPVFVQQATLDVASKETRAIMGSPPVFVEKPPLNVTSKETRAIARSKARKRNRRSENAAADAELRKRRLAKIPGIAVFDDDPFSVTCIACGLREIKLNKHTAWCYSAAGVHVKSRIHQRNFREWKNGRGSKK